MNDLKNGLENIDLAPFKKREIFRFVHQKLAADIDEITSLKKEEREKLKQDYFIGQLKPLKTQKSQGVKKTAFGLDDGLAIEAVFMSYEDEHNTVCVSSQAGCPIGCSFCATGAMGFKRNLTVSEILSQIYYFAKEEKASNVVFMGMGEPFLNYNNVIASAKILNDNFGQKIAARKIVLSTIGVIPGIENLSKEPFQFRLAWSLISPFNDVRSSLIGWEGLPTIEETIQALLAYQQKTKRRITIEYVLLKDINDKKKDLDALAVIARQMDSHVNLIAYNSTPGSLLECGDAAAAWDYLAKKKINVTTRKSLGQKISAACGQLANKAV